VKRKGGFFSFLLEHKENKFEKHVMATEAREDGKGRKGGNEGEAKGNKRVKREEVKTSEVCCTGAEGIYIYVRDSSVVDKAVTKQGPSV